MTDKLTIDVDRDGWTGKLQVSLQQTNEKGSGWGYRLAGPKFNGSSKNLISQELSQRDADEIRGHLNAVFPLAVWLLDQDEALSSDPEVFASERAAKDAAIRSYRDANQIGLFDDDPEPDFAWREHLDGGVELYADAEATGLVVRRLVVKTAAAELAPKGVSVDG